MRCLHWILVHDRSPKKSWTNICFANSSAQWAKYRSGNHIRNAKFRRFSFCCKNQWGVKNGWEKFRKIFLYMYNCGVGCTCHERTRSTAPLRAKLGTLRAGSPLRVRPNPLWRVWVLLVPQVQPYTWGPKSKTQKSKNKYSKSKNPYEPFRMCFWMCLMKKQIQRTTPKAWRPKSRFTTPRSLAPSIRIMKKNETKHTGVYHLGYHLGSIRVYFDAWYHFRPLAVHKSRCTTDPQQLRGYKDTRKDHKPASGLPLAALTKVVNKMVSEK